MAQLYDRYLGIQWEERPTDHSIWKRVDHIPNAELWRTHERRRERLVAFARDRLRAQLTRRGAPPSEIARAEEVLDPEALTIGFARRFAPYKRGGPLPRPGRGRVAEQSPAAAGGLGHQRHEGLLQRRHQPVGPRRLVGRGQ